MKQKYKRINAIAPVVLVSVLVLLGAFTVVNAQGQDDGANPAKEPNVMAPSNDIDPLLFDAQVYASNMNVSVEEALRRFKLQDIPMPEEELSMNESGTFAGLWIEHTPELKFVVQFTRDGEETMKPYLKKYPELADIIEVRNTAKVSLADLRRAQANASYSARALDIPVESDINVYNNSVELYMTKSDRSRFDDALQRNEIQIPDIVRVITVEAEAMGNLIGGDGNLDVVYNYFFGLDPASHEVIVTYGKLPELETEEQRQNWSYSIGELGESLKTELPSSYMHPNGKVMTCGSNSRGCFVILFYENLTKTDPLINEIYTMIDEKAKSMGVQDIPVEFGCGVYYQDYENTISSWPYLTELERKANEEYMKSGRGIKKQPEVIATYGTLPEFENREQWLKWVNVDCGVIIAGVRDKMDPYFYPAEPLVSYGADFDGYIEMRIHKNLTVEKPLLDELYGIIDEEAKKNGFYEVPVRFVFGSLIQPDILVEDSEDETPPPEETSSKSVPGFGLLGGLIAVLCGWIFIRKRA